MPYVIIKKNGKPYSDKGFAFIEEDVEQLEKVAGNNTYVLQNCVTRDIRYIPPKAKKAK